MKQKLLGPTGLRVWELCPGTMTFGEDFGWGTSPEVSKKIFHHYVESFPGFPYDILNDEKVNLPGMGDAIYGSFKGSMQVEPELRSLKMSFFNS